ncbi:MAG: hypothetical protein ACYC3F_07685 [Gemmatimonadaceae bacterium]
MRIALITTLLVAVTAAAHEPTKQAPATTAAAIANDPVTVTFPPRLHRSRQTIGL